jgi:hypothetical protein
LLPAARYKGSCEFEYIHEAAGETANGLVQKTIKDFRSKIVHA